MKHVVKVLAIAPRAAIVSIALVGALASPAPAQVPASSQVPEAAPSPADSPQPSNAPIEATPPEAPDAAADPQSPPGVQPTAPVPQRFPFPRGNPVFRLGSSYNLGPGDEAREVVVIAGDARIEGRIFRDVVVILGSARLTSTAVIDGSLVVVGGRATIDAGARVGRDFVVIGGDVTAPPGFMPGSEHVIIGTEAFGVRFEPLVPWVTRGLLWGRPIVPDLDWVWGVVAFFFLVYLALNTLLDRPVQACARTLSERPLTALGVGLLGLLLVGPVFLLLAVSVVGIVVIPFAACAVLLAWVVGKIGVARAIGLSMIAGPNDSGMAPTRAQATVAFAIGFGVLCLAYMIPILGVLMWTMVGVIGLGAATLAFASGYRRENRVPNGSAPVLPTPSGSDPAAAPPLVPPPPMAPSFAPPPASPARDASASGAVSLAAMPPQDAAHAADMSLGHRPESVGLGTAADDSSSAHAGGAPFGAPPNPPATPPPPPPAAGGPALLSFRRAYFRERLAAFALDVLLVAITVSILDLSGRNGERTVVLLLLAYYISFWAWKGTTVGGIICQLRVVRTTGAPLQVADAFVRGLSSILSMAALGLGGFWILVDQERQAWHDKVAGTYVVKVPRNWPV